MSRPIRIEYSGAIYHVTSRGNARSDIVLGDADREMFVETLASVVERFEWICHAWCLMNNHYHLLIETPKANLSRGMRQLNGVYTQKFNRSHRRVGHLFQGRYKAILVERNSYLLELCRYIVLNPVAAHMVDDVSAWRWSSYRATVGIESKPGWLTVAWVLGQFAQAAERARKHYRDFVAEGVGKGSVWGGLRHQVYLGSDAFVEQSIAEIKIEADLSEIPCVQRQGEKKSIEAYASESTSRSKAMARAYLEAGFSMKEIAAYFKVHYSTVSRAVRKHENDN